jgi:hypothetical protein
VKVKMSAVRATVLIASVLLFSCSAEAQSTAKTHAAHSGDLVSALEFISTTYHLPVIAELTRSYPAHVSLPEGNDTPEQLLNALAGQSPGHGWAMEGGVALFYDIQLHDAAGNFFNSNIPRFVVPGDLAELLLELNQAMGASGKARVMAGIPEKALATVRLAKGEVFTDITGREVLLQAAKQSKNIFSVVLFPSANPRTPQDLSQARMNWYVRSVDELKQNPTRLRSIPGES